jgi:methionyl-tRNA synthetase
LEDQFKRTTVTAALPYANGPVHIGHLAGCYLPADIYARYLRSKGKDVKFICGSDEHGAAISIRAKKEGISSQQVIDKYHKMMGDAFKDFGISFDIYARTSSTTHHKTASEFFTNLYEKNIFSEEITEQYYDEQAKQFLADRYIVGTCPNCNNENAYGDQCENCGSTLNATDLINPHSTLSGAVPILKTTKNWFLPLDKMQGDIENYIDSHKDWKANVYGQCKSWLNQGLQPRAMTRDLDWGVKVPLKDAEGKVLYVWFDAPIGYISATKELTPDWEKYWKSKDTKLVHFIGKDNIVFHCIIFPAILMAHGDYILPENVPANEFLNLEGEKISTSRNWAVWLHEYLQDFAGKQDILRYVLCANAPETKDNDFTWKDFQARNNNELVAVFGNFINRVMVLSHKYFDGKAGEIKDCTPYDLAVLAEMQSYPAKIAKSIEQYRFREALVELMNLARLGNKYLADTEPWKISKEESQRIATILAISLQIAANLAILSEPFLPFTSKSLFEQLNLTSSDWNTAGAANLIPAGHQLGAATLLFAKIEDEQMDAQLAKLTASKKENEKANHQMEAQKPLITFDDFSNNDMRVGTIIAAKRVPKTKNLLKMTIDTGIDQRTVVSGIAAYYEPENIIGQQVTILVNLAPRDIKGITSEGMILMAENADGSLVFIAPTKAISNGGSVK